MAVIETWLNQDLQKPVNVQYIDGSLFSNNANGNRIGVVVTDNGEPVTISGTVSGYVVVSDGSTVPCTGAKSGNRASILIPTAAYVPGSAFISLFITDGTTVTTLAALSTTVLQTRTGTQVDPGSVVTDWTQTINGAMQDVQTAAANLGSIVATPYASLTYPVPLGKYTYYDGGLYRCISPIASSETFTPAHWTAVKLGDDVSDLKSAINNHFVKDRTFNIFNKNDVAPKTISSTGQESASDSVFTTESYEELKSPNLICNYNGFRAVYYNQSYGFIERSASTNANTVLVAPTGAKYVRFIITATVYNVHADEIVISNRNALPYEYVPYGVSLNAIDIVPQVDSAISEIATTHDYGNLFDSGDFILGTINTIGEETSSTTVLKSLDYLEIQATYLISNYNFYAVFYDENYDFLSRVSISANTAYAVSSNVKYVRFIVAKTVYDAHFGEMIIANSNTLPGWWTPNEVRYITIEANTRKKVFGRQFLIYKFGGDGNDWCFVRTPANYDPFRAKPYPFVICNHGNGTVMDGSEYTATWTPRTMYLDPENEHYNASYDMIATTDPDLQYSNPTMEKFLSNGYIVCGCENYDDRLFGNDNCRKACADFYEHMVRTYNVHDWCYMIGASNGAQTSINAAFLLREKVRAMVLQYPLTCLLNQYNAYPDHRARIRQVYGISNSDPTEAELIQATLTHDVLHWDKGDYFNVYFPPVKLYYSLGDTVVPAEANSLALISELQKGYKVYDSVVCSGNHGNASHFDPDGFYAFLSAH